MQLISVPTQSFHFKYRFYPILYLILLVLSVSVTFMIPIGNSVSKILSVTASSRLRFELGSIIGLRLILGLKLGLGLGLGFVIWMQHK